MKYRVITKIDLIVNELDGIIQIEFSVDYDINLLNKIWEEYILTEIYNNLFIGNEIDYERNVRGKNGWAIVHACKEPYHRQAVGYSGRACAKTHPEYLLAQRGNHLMLNLVDVDNPDWVSPIIVDKTINFVDANLSQGLKVLIHCNQGMSRSAGLGLLYLAHIGRFHGMDFISAETQYITVYPPYQPAGGIRGYCMMNWNIYCK